MQKQVLFIVLILSLAFGAGIWREKHKQTEDTYAFKRELDKSLSLNSGTWLVPAKEFPSFKLLDHNNQDFSELKLMDKWSFMFFGYTACPDICPKTLGSLQQIAQRIGTNTNAQFLFVSITPEQDNAARLKDYLSQPRFVGVDFTGLTGNIASIKQLAESVGIFFGDEAPNLSDSFDQHIEHSGTILLVNPEGKLQAIFSGAEKPAQIAQDFREILHKYSKA